MRSFINEIGESVTRLFFPHVCAGCRTDLLPRSTLLCLRCMADMPRTWFEESPHNPVEKKFWGRLPLIAATAQYYYNRESLMQHLIHQFKYGGDKSLGLQLGRIMGKELKASGRFEVDVLVPLPLSEEKERRRGFNQAFVLCQGMADVMRLPVFERIVTRPLFTETQTRKGRIDRWRNMEGKFCLADTRQLANKHILLVDDVVTTGATLEACGSEILRAQNARLSLATLCYASD